MSGTWGGGKERMPQSHKPQKQENIPQLCVCARACVGMCMSVCVAAMNSKPGCKLQEEREGGVGGAKGVELYICYSH